MKYLLLTSVLFICGCASGKVDIMDEICEANNLYEIYDNKQLEFTFNVEKGDKLVKSRAWKWDIENDRIYMDGKEVGKSPEFINDIYWLAFPLLVQETRDQVELSVNHFIKAPSSKEVLTEVAVKYVSDDGKSPNDTYKIYVDDNYLVKEWAYFKTSKEPAKLISSWEDYMTFNGVNFSVNRPSEGGIRIFFSDIRLK